jgi:hypothetical protein
MMQENGTSERPAALKRRKKAFSIGSTPDEHKCFPNAVRLLGQTMKSPVQSGGATLNKFGEDGPNPGYLDYFSVITKISTGDIFRIIHRGRRAYKLDIRSDHANPRNETGQMVSSGSACQHVHFVKNHEPRPG